MTKALHVAPTRKGKWEVRKEGAKRAESLHDTAAAALRRAEALASAGGAEIRVHESEKDDWRKQASERAVGTRLQGEKPVSPGQSTPGAEIPRGVDAIEDEGFKSHVTDADTSPSLQGQNTRTGKDLEDKIVKQDRK
jgi:hypothetical protein